MLSQVPVGGAQVVDVTSAGLHAAGVVHETGQLPGGKGRGLVSQQLRNILLQTDKGAGSESLQSSWTQTGEPMARGRRGSAGLTPGGWAHRVLQPGGSPGGLAPPPGHGTLVVPSRSHIKRAGRLREHLPPRVTQGLTEQGFLGKLCTRPSLRQRPVLDSVPSLCP